MVTGSCRDVGGITSGDYPVHPLGDIDDGVLRGIFLRAIQTADNDASQSIELSRLIGFTMHLVALRRPWARGSAAPPMRLSRFKRVEMPCRPRPPSTIRDTTMRVAAVGVRQPRGVAHKARSHSRRQQFDSLPRLGTGSALAVPPLARPGRIDSPLLYPRATTVLGRTVHAEVRTGVT